MSTGKPRTTLRPGEAATSMAMRLSRVVDIGRDVEARLGFRPYQVFLVWQRWTGPERGDGTREEIARCELLPRPTVDDMTSIQRAKTGAGAYGQGSLRVSEISARYTHEQLSGLVIPDRDEDQVPQPYDFFWEVVEDDRHGPAPVRRRFSPSTEPAYDASAAAWTMVLAKTSDDRDREGKPVDGPVLPPRDPMVAEPVDSDDDF